MKWFLSKVFWLVTEIRNWLFDSGVFRTTKISLPVVSVGNIHVGGTGKTPLVIFLALELKKKGYRPVVLSRGYKGRLAGPHIVDGNDSYTDVGDEPILIKRKAAVPVVISKDRVKGAKFIEEKDLGDLVILDDGFQHRWLYRDVNILILPSETGSLLPLGTLREDIKNRSRADIIIDNPERVYYLHAKNPTPSLVLQPLTLVTGIANPSRVKSSIEKLGFKVGEFITFPDHHPFSIKEREKYKDAVTTEKDLVRFPEARAYVGYDVRVPGLVDEIVERLRLL